MDADSIGSLISELNGDAALLEPLCAELRLLYAMPQLKPFDCGTQILFDTDKNLSVEKRRAQNRGFRASLLCCGQKQVRCNEKLGAAACPTWVEAARQFRRMVETKHSGTACLECVAAKRERFEEPAVQAPAAAPKPNLFQRMAAASLAEQRAASAFNQAQKELEQISKQEQLLGDQRKKVAAELRQSAATMNELGKTKKQRTESASVAGGSSSAPTLAQAAPCWHAWSLDTWRRLEALSKQRRAVKLEKKKLSGRSRRGLVGPLWHKRRGLIGALQDWAEGSETRAAELLVKLIEHFGLQVRIPMPLAPMHCTPLTSPFVPA